MKVAEIIAAVEEVCGLGDERPTPDQIEALIGRLQAMAARAHASAEARVRAELRTGLAERDQRQPGESDVDFVQRLAVGGLYFDATDNELAQVTRLPVARVREIRRELDRSQALRGMAAHARTVALTMGWRGRPRDLVTVALEEYAQRHTRPVEARGASVATSPAASPGSRQSAAVARRESTNDGRTVVPENDGGAQRRGANNPRDGVAASAAHGRTHAGSGRTDKGGSSTSPRPDLSHPLAHRRTA